MYEVVEIKWSKPGSKYPIEYAALESHDEPIFFTFYYPYMDGPLELMEYTGLKDKNGVRIYEGDIVSYMHYEYNTGGMGNEIRKKEVKWIDKVAGFNLSDEEHEVIGNIYENPELIKK